MLSIRRRLVNRGKEAFYNFSRDITVEAYFTSFDIDVLAPAPTSYSEACLCSKSDYELRTLKSLSNDQASQRRHLEITL